MLNEKQIEIIKQSFSDKATVIYKTVQDKNGVTKTFTGRATPYIIERLNEVFNHGWSFEVKQFESIKGWGIIAVVRLSFYDENGQVFVKEQAGGCKYINDGTYVTIDKETGEKKQAIDINYGDTLSGAITSALAKASSLIGIGLDAYKGELEPTKKAIENYDKANSDKFDKDQLRDGFWQQAGEKSIVNSKELTQFVEWGLETGVLDPSVYDKLPRDKKTGELNVEKFKSIDWQYVTNLLNHYDTIVAEKNGKQA